MPTCRRFVVLVSLESADRRSALQRLCTDPSRACLSYGCARGHASLKCEFHMLCYFTSLVILVLPFVNFAPFTGVLGAHTRYIPTSACCCTRTTLIRSGLCLSQCVVCHPWLWCLSSWPFPRRELLPGIDEWDPRCRPGALQPRTRRSWFVCG